VRLRVIDLETTGQAPPAEIIEFGRADVHDESGVWQVEAPLSRLYRPLNGIPPETMAVHHITLEEVGGDTAVCTEDLLRKAIWGGAKPDVLVAHNCGFERQFINDVVCDGLPWICTYKAALRVWPEAPRHSNQVLRYWRGLKLDAAFAMPPHRAGPDAWVTAHLLAEMLNFAGVDQLVAWTSEPRCLPTVPFGKHRGSRWQDAPQDYLQWMGRQTDMDADVQWCAHMELKRRAASSVVAGAASSQG